MADAPIEPPVIETQFTTINSNSTLSLNKLTQSSNKLFDLLNNKGDEAIMHDDSLDKGTEAETGQNLSMNGDSNQKFIDQIAKKSELPKIINTESAFVGKQDLKGTEVSKQQVPEISILNRLTSTTGKSSITIVPAIKVVAGPPPPKRNVAVKNTSAGLHRHHQKLMESNRLKKVQSVSRYRLSDEDNMFTDKEETSFEYNSNDEFVPKNICSDGSDDMDGVSKRKSARLSKKPKILDEYVIDSSQDSLNSKNLSQESDIQRTQIVKSSDPPQLPNRTQYTGPKQFARKSTAPATLSQISHIKKLQANKITSSHSQYTPTSTLTTTVLTNSNNNQNVVKQQQGITQVLNGSHNSALNKIVNSKNITQVSSSSNTISHLTPVAKQYKNKIISCKPFCESKGTECVPIVKDASTQIDLDEIKLNHTVVPVPVPIHVPLPMCMYQAPMPIPMLIPIPIPVPVFIPTTMKTYDRIQRRIQKLRKKLPSDPYEFEILLYAEKLAREEGIPGFEDSSDGESEPETNFPKRKKLKIYDQESNQNTININNNNNTSSINTNINNTNSTSNIPTIMEQKNTFIQNDHNNQLIQPQQQPQQPQIQQTEQEGNFKWVYGVNLFNTWFLNRMTQLKANSPSNNNRLPDDLLKLKNDELNILLADFVHEIRKPSGEIYAPESVYYLCLGIQYYLQEKGRVENIFLDNHIFNKFQDSLNEIAMRYQIRINTEGQITSRIEEEILWESKQLGAYSPFVLLNTILYFNTKYFFLDKPESHLQLSFTNVKKHSKRNIGPNGEDYGKTVYLRYYPDFHGLEQVIYEQGENYDNPLRCPVELYNFYLSKCPESAKNRNDVFYLLPEKASLPSSPVWFSSQPISTKMLERMINRIKMVREVNELLLAASPAPATTSII